MLVTFIWFKLTEWSKRMNYDCLKACSNIIFKIIVICITKFSFNIFNTWLCMIMIRWYYIKTVPYRKNVSFLLCMPCVVLCTKLTMSSILFLSFFKEGSGLLLKNMYRHTHHKHYIIHVWMQPYCHHNIPFVFVSSVFFRLYIVYSFHYSSYT